MPSDPWPIIPDETPLDISGMTPKAKEIVLTRADLNELESKNIQRVFVKYLARKPSAAKAPFHQTWAIALHGEMFSDVWVWAGQPRRQNLNRGIEYQRIIPSLEDLFLNLASWSGYGVPLVKQAARLHHQAVHIHPFENGNGRWARMLANIWLKRHGEPVITWPNNEIRELASPIRNEYVRAIQAADKGDDAPLIELHERFTEQLS